MSALTTITKPGRWTILEEALPADLATPAELLTANGHFKSLARIVSKPDGRAWLRAEVPLTSQSASLAEDARQEMARFKRGRIEDTPVDLADLSTETTELALAATRECGWAAEVRAGGEIVIPLSEGRAQAEIGALGGLESACLEALPSLPKDQTCRNAVLAFALRATASVRLVRAVLVEEERLHWQVPVPAFEADLLGHAFSALATMQLTGSRELTLLAASTALASNWLSEHHQQQNQT